MVNAQEKDFDEREYEEELNDIYGDVNICGLEYPAGRVLREIDPIAFRTSMTDRPITWLCDECGAEFDEEDDAEECCN